MITRAEVLMGRDKEFPLSTQNEQNLVRLLNALNRFRNIYGKPMVVSSGYRPGVHNKIAGGAPKSAHMTCEAVDFKDEDGLLKKYILENQHLLEQCGLYMEHPLHTPTWCHLQTRPTKARIFKP